MSPFQGLYGRPIPDLHRYTPGDSNMASIDATLTELHRLRRIIKENLTRAQQRMASHTNTHRLDMEFQVGDRVFLRLRDYRQHSVHYRTTKKLSKRFYGPFTILERIGKVAYRLELPPGARIHPVFHITLLRQAFGEPTPTTLPEFVFTNDSTIQPSQLLNHRNYQE
ncbi:hypothetical protein LXL04_014867 [Taraxacum kok-saghyz]